ncbi:MAG: hypothetical protein SangKO_045350 [Sandaracinaceae bacterium]
MSELLGITVGELVATMKERRVRIPSEIGAFIALEVCEALEDGPAPVRSSDVRIADDGAIGVFAPPGSASSDEAARAVVAMLGSLLVAAGTGVPKVLVQLLEDGPTSGRWDLSSLRDDLEASLVPLNRAAARRVLARMLREAQKPRSVAPSSRPAPRDATLDAQLDDLLGPDEPEPAVDEPDAARDLDAELDATIDELGAPSTAEIEAARRPPSERPVPEDDVTLADDTFASAGPSADDRTIANDEPAPVSAPPRRPQREVDTLTTGLDESPRRASLVPWILAALAILAATAAGLALMRPDLVDAALGRPPAPVDPGPTEADRERMLREHRGRFGTLSVEVQPARAQVLMLVGEGPATAEELPLGMALEFVAIADGRTPTRAVLPADASWEETEAGHRYELAMQTGDAPMAPEELALGETRLPQDVGAPTGALGSVRVITNPPGAKVYVLVGFAPSVVVENVRTDAPIELLVYHEGHPVLRHTIAPEDWEENEDGSKRASASLTLEGVDEGDEG